VLRLSKQLLLYLKISLDSNVAQADERDSERRRELKEQQKLLGLKKIFKEQSINTTQHPN
jgi:hypothetical protein